MSQDVLKALVRRLVTEAQQNGNLALIDDLIAPDFVDHSPLPGVPGTRDGFRALFAGCRAAFPDLRISIEDQVADDTSVATRKRFRGTHKGPFMGVPASGRTIDFEVIDMMKIRDGRITDHWVVVDQMLLLTQLGAISAPAA
jgi:steroid delta-isomerase-like uncharacterized protein